MKLRDAGYREKAFVKARLAIARDVNDNPMPFDFDAVLDGVEYDSSRDIVYGRWVVQPAALNGEGAGWSGIAPTKVHVSIVCPGHGVRDCAETLRLHGMDDADCR